MVNNILQEAADGLQEAAESLTSRLSKRTSQLMWTGIILGALGVAALVWPQISTLSVTLIIGWILFFAGLVTFFGSFSYEGTGPFFGALLTALLMIGLGLFFVFRPQEGMLVMTLTLGILFIVQAAFQTVMAFEIRKTVKGWGWLLLAAILSAVLAFIILANLLNASYVVLGILLGVNLLFTGIAMVMISSQLKKGVNAVMPNTAKKASKTS